MRLVVDVNIMIRALLSPGPAREFFRLAPLQHKLLFHSEQTFELREVAGRARLQIRSEAVEELIDRLSQYGSPVSASLNSVSECRDPNDDYLLAIASVGSADAILTEDQDLLVMNPWRGIRILRLYQFLQEFPLGSDHSA